MKKPVLMSVRDYNNWRNGQGKSTLAFYNMNNNQRKTGFVLGSEKDSYRFFKTKKRSRFILFNS
jgi:hypothetical protein